MTCNEKSLHGPIVCPHCGITVQCIVMADYTPTWNRRSIIYLVRCLNCDNPFATYQDEFAAEEKIIRYPNSCKRIFDSEIASLSERFCNIYNQALFADTNGCLDIAGMGYRKALEVLIKDYLIHFKKEDPETIKNMSLSNCIQNKIDNPNLKTTASRSAWLGNDYAHYTTKFIDIDKDINDLKRYIDATLHWISLELITYEAGQLEKR